MDSHSTSATDSALIDIRTLRAKEAARISMPTLDFVLSVGAPVSALGSPDAVKIASPARQQPWRAIAIAFTTLAVVLAASVGHDLGARTRQPATVDAAAPVVASTETSAPPSAAVEHPSEVDVAPASTSEALPAPAARPVRRARPVPSAPVVPATESVSVATREPVEPGSPTVDELIARAVGTSTVATTSESVPALRTAPTREEVRAALDALAPAMAACADTRRGRALSTIVVSGETGRVRSSRIDGDFIGTTEGSCMARALRALELEPFERTTFTISYPFVF